MKFLRCLLVLLAVFAAAPAPAQDDPFAGLASENFDDVSAAIAALALSGNPQAGPTITALQNDALFAGPDGALLIQTDDGYLDARTGQKAADVNEDDLNPVRVNNAVRRAIDAALGSLNLFSASADARIKAAGEVFISRDPAALPALTRALAQEKDAAVRAVMEQARAAARLADPTTSEPDKLAAIATIRARGDLDSRSLLSSLSNQPPAVAAAAAAALAAIDHSEQLWSLAQSVFYGLSLGSVLLLAAAGLAITFGVMGVINMAHGEMVMLGAYTTFVVQQAIPPGLAGWSLPIAVPMAFLVSGAIGIAIER
jgi:urea transport system permease protein